MFKNGLIDKLYHLCGVSLEFDRPIKGDPRLERLGYLRKEKSYGLFKRRFKIWYYTEGMYLAFNIYKKGICTHKSVAALYENVSQPGSCLRFNPTFSVLAAICVVICLWLWRPALLGGILFALLAYEQIIGIQMFPLRADTGEPDEIMSEVRVTLLSMRAIREFISDFAPRARMKYDTAKSAPEN